MLIKNVVLYLFLEHAYELLCKVEATIYISVDESPVKKWFQHLSERKSAV